jgi:chemotaxis protein CheD
MALEAVSAPDVYYVEPGQLLVSTEPCTLRTILGSCITICLFDPEQRIGGMNHYMLASSFSQNERSLRHGNIASPELLSRLLRLGCQRSTLRASVYGGARVLSDVSDLMHLGRRNAEFAIDWLHEQRIAIVASDILGNCARRLDFHVSDGTASVRLLGGG